MIPSGLFTAERLNAQPPPTPDELVNQPFFADERRFTDLTAEVRVTIDPQTGVAVTAAATPSVEASGGGRQSIDVDLVTAIVTDRARQAAMMAVADAVHAAGGPDARRRYVQDLLGAAQALLLDRAGLHRTNVENLVLVLSRMVIADAIVRTRFPHPHRLDRAQYFQQRLCSPSAVRTQGSSEREHCEHMRGHFPNRETDPALTRAYLVDLAYWRLGAAGIFPATGDAHPPCPWELGEPGSSFCSALTDGNNAEERVDWLLRLSGVMDGLTVARLLEPIWRNPNGAGLRALLRAVVRSDRIGVLGRSLGLTADDFRSVAGLAALFVALSSLTDLVTAMEAYMAAPSPERMAAINAEATRLEHQLFGGEGVCLEGRRVAGMKLCSDALAEYVAELKVARERIPRIRGAVADVFTNVGRGAAAIRETRVALELSADRIARRSADIEARFGSVHRLADLSLDDASALLGSLIEIHLAMHDGATALRRIPRSLVPWEALPQSVALDRSMRAVQGTTRLLQLVSSIDHEAALTARLGTVGQIMGAIETLGFETPDRRLYLPILELLQPVLRGAWYGEAFDMGMVFAIASRLTVQDVVSALGLFPLTEDDIDAVIAQLDPCAEDEASLGCWTARIVQALREATSIGGNRIAIDGEHFRNTLAALGDDFRRRNNWRWYFHLTIGLGEITTFGAAPGSENDDVRLVPLVAEQVGLGIASPSFAGDRLAFRAGFFGSGILYRVVLDSVESESVMFGAFAAIDVYEIIELYIAPVIMLHVPTGDEALSAQFGIAVGAQVPLSDYLDRL